MHMTNAMAPRKPIRNSVPVGRMGIHRGHQIKIRARPSCLGGVRMGEIGRPVATIAPTVAKSTIVLVARANNRRIHQSPRIRPVSRKHPELNCSAALESVRSRVFAVHRDSHCMQIPHDRNRRCDQEIFWELPSPARNCSQQARYGRAKLPRTSFSHRQSVSHNLGRHHW